MARYSQQLIEERYQKLPEELKQAIYGEDIALKIFDLGRKYGITIEKNGFLAEEIAYIMLGLSKVEDFSKFIKERLDFNDEETTEIVKDVNQQILYPLRESLKRTHQMEIAEEKPVEAVVTKPPPPIVTPKPDTFPQIIPKEEVEKIKEEFSRKPFVSPVAEEKPSKTPPPPPPPRPIEVPTKDKQRIGEIQKTEPIPPPPPIKPKIAPIDLRQGMKPRPTPPEMMRGVIFAPPAKRESEIMNKELGSNEIKKEEVKPQPAAPAGQPKPEEKKSVTRNFDPYREPVE